MARFFFFCGIFLTSIFNLADGADFKTQKAKAETLYQQGSFQLAREKYQAIDTKNLNKADAKWVAFRVPDTTWRALAQTNTADTSDSDEARTKLEALFRTYGPNVAKDDIFPHLAASLGDYWWMRKDQHNWHAGWPYYQAALEYWANSSEINQARKEYLSLIWRLSDPEWQDRYYSYGYYGNYLPVLFVENAIKIAKEKNDIARANYLLGVSLRQYGGDEIQIKRIPIAFEKALEMGKQNAWYDDALFGLGEFYLQMGESIPLKEGGFRREPNFEKALGVYRRILSEFRPGESRFYDQAKARIEEITRPSLQLAISSYFLPDSEIAYNLAYRNVKAIDFAIYEMSLTSGIRWEQANQGFSEWLKSADLNQAKKIRTWRRRLENTGYRSFNEQQFLEKKLPVGAYVFEATSDNGVKSREFVLVTDATLVVKTAPKKALIYFAEALNGAPIANATVVLWHRFWENGVAQIKKIEQKTDAQGLCLIPIHSSSGNSSEMFVAAQSFNRQAFSQNYYQDYSRDSHASWKLYVFTDRPTYRPEEKASWKVIARQQTPEGLITPANTTLAYRIYDARGTQVKEGSFLLNAFGSAWDQLQLKKEWALGAYRIEFYSAEFKKHLGSAQMFQVEEFKLPEFKVSVVTPTENNRKKTFRLGDVVEAEILAEYYSGGGVPNAQVNVIVYQKAYHQPWPILPRPMHRHSELDRGGMRYIAQQARQVVKQETLKTNAQGKVKITFETPAQQAGDLQYDIEARVVDLSRREVIGVDQVRVTRQSYFVNLSTQHQIYKPRQRVRVQIKSHTPNDDALSVSGEVKVYRNRYKEIWVDAQGGEVPKNKIDALRKYKEPRDVSVEQKPYQLKWSGYEEEEIVKTPVNTNVKGEAEFVFTPEKDGYFTIRWLSVDDRNEKVTTQVAVFVADEKSTNLGYHHGGLDLVLDQDSFRPGETAPVMIFSPVSDRHVLFSVESEDLESYQVLHLTGTVKLVSLSILDKHVPNLFLSAFMVADAQVHHVSEQVNVPATKNFLSVKVTPKKSSIEPRQEALLDIEALDHQGLGVMAEVALAVIDESVFYYGDSNAQDPKDFFFGDPKPQKVSSTHSLMQRRLQRLVRDAKGDVRDERSLLTLQSSVGRKSNEMRDDMALPSVLGLAKDERMESLSMGTAAEGSARPRAIESKSKRQMKEMDEQGGDAEVIVRSDFRATAFWQPNVMTGRDGRATIKVKMPDDLTSWRVKALAHTLDQKIGEDGKAAFKTQSPLMVRLQAPRFFVVGDVVTLSAVISNQTEKTLELIPSLEAKGLEIKDLQKPSVSIPPMSQKRLDWTAQAMRPGNVKIKMVAKGALYSDAVEKSFVAYEHGIEKLLAKSTKARGKETLLTLNLPKARRAGSMEFSVQVAPSLAVTMLDALPYLIDFPYGCTEQTMSRFMPTVVVLKTLADLGLSRDAAAQKIFGGIEQKSKKPQGPKKDLEKIDAMVKSGLQRLYDFQHGDGGWGWWKEGQSDPFMSAYVLQGMVLAEQAGVGIKHGSMDRAAGFLLQRLVNEEKNYDIQSFLLYALATYRAQKNQKVHAYEKKAFQNLFDNRAKLNAYTRALTTLAAHHFKFSEQKKILVDNLENGVKWDKTADQSIVHKGGGESSAIALAHWGEDGIFWRWSDGGVEATAWGLRALLAADPRHRLIEPVTQWLIKNRRGAQWSNTRDTAMVVMALNDYLQKSGELKSNVTYEVYINGNSQGKNAVTPQTLLSQPSLFSIKESDLRDGDNQIRILKLTGDAPLYVSAFAKFFSEEEPIKEAGNEIFVTRRYVQWAPRDTLLKGKVLEEKPLDDEAIVTSNDRIDVVLTVEAKNHYEYLMFEDFKPAGFEAVQLKSGEALYARELKSKTAKRRFRPVLDESQSGDPQAVDNANEDYTQRSAWVYQELRDQKAAFFIDQLKEGIWEIRYQLRAEVPGKFHALPLMGQAMYVPEIRSNSDEMRVTVKEGVE